MSKPNRPPNRHGHGEAYNAGERRGKGTRHKGATRPATPPSGGQKPPAQGCCPMVAAVRAARQGRWRLAARYARWSVRLLTARIA